MPASVPTVSLTLAGRRDALTARIRAAALNYGRNPDDIHLCAVSKTQPDAALDEMLATGQRLFGENRVQEAQAHWAHRRDALPDLRLHLIGPLQTNKVAAALDLFDVIETIDRPSLIEAVARGVQKRGACPGLLVQVNIGDEPQKAGVSPSELEDLVTQMRTTYSLQPTGLMCIPPVDEPPGPHFALLAHWGKRLGLTELSMGMSGDFETAIRFGATELRLGTMLFGERMAPAS